MAAESLHPTTLGVNIPPTTPDNGPSTRALDSPSSLSFILATPSSPVEPSADTIDSTTRCANTNCRRMTSHRNYWAKSDLVSPDGRLCSACAKYAKKHNVLRPLQPHLSSLHPWRLDVGNLALLQQLSRSHLRRQVTALELISPAGYSTQISLHHHRGGRTGTALCLPNTRVVKNPDVTVILPALLRDMKNLRDFHWNVADITPPPGIFNALQSLAPALKCVRIHSLRTHGNNDVPDQWFMPDAPLWRLANLTSFSFAVSSLTTFYHTGLYVKLLFEMLGRCPMLEELELLLAHDRASDLQGLFQLRWPRLKSLLLGGPMTNYSVSVPRLKGKADVQGFFLAHPTLERLYLSINLRTQERPVSYPWGEKSSEESFCIDSLPKLKLLHVPQNIFAMVAPTVLMPDLEHLRRVEAEPSTFPLFRELTQNTPNITSIWLALHRTITLPAVKSFFECLPNLEKLYLSNGPPDPWVPISPVVDHASVYHAPGRDENFARGAPVAYTGPHRTVDDPLAKTIDALRALTRLTHLEHFIVFHAHSGLDVLVDPVVRQLAAALPRLAFVEVYISTGLAPGEETGELLSDGSTWLGIQRDAGGVCIGWNVIAEADEERLQLDYRLWGSLKWILDEAPHYNDPRDRM
ncbi:hypothetical protein C8R46DRAFT_1274050 [Mycena filopes]|nr:hypothetical protein C8R46DRAFT_1274050 [Mycena filopes]